MRNVLVILLLPPCAPLLLIGLGLLLRRWWRWAAVLTGWLLAWAFSTEAFVDTMAQRWAPMPSSAQTVQSLSPWAQQAHTVVLVVGGGLSRGAHADGTYDLKFETQERLRRGLWWAKRLSLPAAYTGGIAPNALPDQPTEARIAARVAREEYGFPLAWVEDQSVDTRDNARRSAVLLRAQGIRQVVLVTHGMHMRRTLRAFHEAAPEIEFRPAAVTRDPGNGYILSDFFPSSSGVQRGRYLAYEVVGYLAGK